MTSIVFYFEVHQPHRLKHYTVFDDHPFYFDDEKNRAICEKVADKCYRPATRLLLDLVRRHEGNFRVSFSITGTALDQFERFCPDVIELFQDLSRQLDLNLFYSQRGHFTLAHSPASLRTQRWRAEVNKHLGIDSEVVGPSFIKKAVPQLDLTCGGHQPPVYG